MASTSSADRSARLIAALPLAAGLGLASSGAADPLLVPALGGLSIGFAVRGPRPVELAALALFTGAVLAPSLGLGLCAWIGLVALGLRDVPRPWLAGVALVAGGAIAVMLLDPGGPLTVLRQLRLLAGAAGVGLLGVGLLAVHRAPLARRVAGLALIAGLLALFGPGVAAWPDGWRLSSPYLAWAAPAASALGALWALRGGSVAVVATLWPLGLLLLAAIGGTGPGLEAAAWSLAGPALAIAAADDDGHLPGPLAALTLGGLPGALPAVAAWAAGSAAWTAAHPAALRWPTLITAAVSVVAFVAVARGIIGQRTSRLDQWLAGGLIALGVLLASGWRPTAPAGEAAAAQHETRRLPPDDTRGWRRLWRLEHRPAPPSAPDAGVGR